jgi:hypothetical protein
LILRDITDDFFVIHIEVDGKNNSSQQDGGANRCLIAVGGIETGFGAKIPLWLFGFLYWYYRWIIDLTSLHLDLA